MKVSEHTINIHKESGRTLVETLGVLVIMGLLIFSGIKMYGMIKDKSIAEAVAKHIKAIAINHQIIFSGDSETTSSQYTEKGPYHTELIVENGKNGNLKNYFWITVPAPRTPFCQGLKDSNIIGADLIIVNGELDGDCPGEISFYFRKNTANITTAATYRDEQGKQHLCPKNATCTTNEYTCLDGYYSQGGTCSACPDHVASCEDESTPLSCDEGYYLDEEGCIPCPEEDPTCERVCRTNYSYDEGREKCVPVCNDATQLTCSNETDVWCCGDGLICDRENQSCKDGHNMCVFGFGETTADTTYYTDCSYSVSAADNIASYYTDCSYTVNSTGETVSPNGTRGGCPANQYCALLWTASTWGTNDTAPYVTNNTSNQTLYGRCQALATYNTTPLKHYVEEEGEVLPVGGTRGGCPENQYCALLWTAEEWGVNDSVPSVTDSANNQTLYGRCQALATYNTSPLVRNGGGNGFYNIRQECPKGKYCLLKWRQESCTGVQNTDTLIYGTCVLMNQTSGDCPYSN